MKHWPRRQSHGNAQVAGGLQIDLFEAGADHADDSEQGQGGHFIGLQAQRAASQHGVDAGAVSGYGFGAAGGGGRKDQLVALVLQHMQVIVNALYQHQHNVGHRSLQPGDVGNKPRLTPV